MSICAPCAIQILLARLRLCPEMLPLSSGSSPRVCRASVLQLQGLIQDQAPLTHVQPGNIEESIISHFRAALAQSWLVINSSLHNHPLCVLNDYLTSRKMLRENQPQDRLYHRFSLFHEAGLKGPQITSRSWWLFCF